MKILRFITVTISEAAILVFFTCSQWNSVQIKTKCFQIHMRNCNSNEIWWLFAFVFCFVCFVLFFFLFVCFVFVMFCFVHFCILLNTVPFKFVADFSGFREFWCCNFSAVVLWRLKYLSTLRPTTNDLACLANVSPRLCGFGFGTRVKNRAKNGACKRVRRSHHSGKTFTHAPSWTFPVTFSVTLSSQITFSSPEPVVSWSRYKLSRLALGTRMVRSRSPPRAWLHSVCTGLVVQLQLLLLLTIL